MSSEYKKEYDTCYCLCCKKRFTHETNIISISSNISTYQEIIHNIPLPCFRDGNTFDHLSVKWEGGLQRPKVLNFCSLCWKNIAGEEFLP